MIRLMLVDDSVTQREILRRLLVATGEYTIVAEARNGREAVDLVERHKLDVVLMDIHMPELDGVSATREIMQRSPVPIVIASSTLKKRDIDMGLEAFRAGAVAVIEKPEGAALLNLGRIAPELREALLSASKSRVRRLSAPLTAVRPIDGKPFRSVSDIDVIGICVSTGGPPVLIEILSQLPAPYPIPILLVQHIGATFVEGFARWLASSTGQAVQLATPGQKLERGVWISPGEVHLALGAGNRIDLEEGDTNEIHCPSGNVLFSSLASHMGSRALGILLTGMGDDGAAGLLALRKAGGRTVAQDEGSSLIWGMPKAAQDNGAAETLLAPREIVQLMKELSESR